MPEHFRPGERLDVVVFLHGAAWVVEQEFHDARRNAVLVTAAGGSRAETFEATGAFRRFLEAARAAVEALGVPVVTGDDAEDGLQATGAPPRQAMMTDGAGLRLGRVCLASYSGGSAGVRAILADPEAGALITDLLLADSLYGPRSPDDPNRMDPTAMAPFLAFAERAAAGERTFWFTQLYPPEAQYRTSTTTLAADFLIRRLGLQRLPTEEPASRGRCLLYRADRGNCHIRGYAGMSTQDHFEHLYTVGELLARSSLAGAEDAPPSAP